MAIGVAIAMLALAGLSNAVTTTACKDDALCIEEVRKGTAIELLARNLKDFPVTYTLKVRTQAYSVDGPKTITRTLAPRESATAMRLHPREGYVRSDYRTYFEWTIGDFDANHDDDHVYAFPYAPGRSYRILQGYGSRFSHRGLEEFAIDFDMREGTPVHAARAGIVARVEERHNKGCWAKGCGQYANYIVVLHSDGTTGEYYHLKQDGALVEVGDMVTRGQKIGLSGNTGHTALPHLHFAVYRASTWGETQSIPIRFQSADGVISRPRNGGRHQAAH